MTQPLVAHIRPQGVVGFVALVFTNPVFADVSAGVIRGGASTATWRAVLVAKNGGCEVCTAVTCLRRPRRR